MTVIKNAGCLAFLLLAIWTCGCSVPADRPNTPSPEQTSLKCPDPIIAQAVTLFYLPSGKIYYTKQEHRFCPSQKTLVISATEPEGKILWKWADGNFIRQTSVQQRFTAEWQADSFYALFAGFLYGGGFLSTDTLAASEPVNLEGQAYIPIKLPIKTANFDAFLYKNRKTGLIDRVGVYSKTDKKAQMAILYNWSLLGQNNRIVPRKIDIFDITDGIVSKKLMIQIDYKHIL